eukprot:TRINITY_DN7971_c0_g1_i1.p1 TRINITY_DN7971_c0_g1~~TRINITY_DN7971_c0_g1_i1.p1  ORF type:complete len:1887 (+),score=404.79 TRINITY_DN7971_c0_g1_i1:723-5663(+)
MGNATWTNRALFFDSAGGLAAGCWRNKGAYCSGFSLAGGPTGCGPLDSPCQSFTGGIAVMPSGFTGVNCADDGYYLCEPAPTAAPSLAPTAPSAAPSVAPSAAPNPVPSGPPSAAPSRAPSRAPTARPSPAPSASPEAAPSSAPSPAPTAAPSAAPRPPSASPSAPPQAPPSRPPLDPPSRPPSLAPSPPPGLPSAQPSPFPSETPTEGPSRSPAAHPTGSPTSSPSAEPPGAAPTAAPVSVCAAGRVRSGGGECIECTADMVAGGCPGSGGYPGPAADGVTCICVCRFYWDGDACSVCPPGYGGLDCDRCAVGGADPPLCEVPLCARPTSLPDEVVSECGGGARQVDLRPALRHSGIPATVTLTPALSASGTPQLSLPAHADPQVLGGGGLAVEGVEAQLRHWLRLTVVPAEALTHRTPVVINVTVSGGGCTTVRRQLVLRCPVPAPRVSGALPAPAVPEGGSLSFPCPLAEQAHTDPPFEVRSSLPGALSYDSGTGLCTVSAAGVPGNGTTAVITVTAPGAPPIDLPVHIRVNPPACGSGVRFPLYLQLPPGGKGYESVGALSLADLNGTLSALHIVWPDGRRPGVSAHLLGGALRVTASHDAEEGTLYVILRYAANNGTLCAVTQPVYLFWGPAFVGPAERIRQPVGRYFEHVLSVRPLANVGSPPWCPEPVLGIAQQPGGLALSPRGVLWVVNGSLQSAGAALVYLAAVDCRGGRVTLLVELYGVDGTELGPLADTTYLEDTPLRMPFPRLLSTATELNITVGPQLDAQLLMGNLSARCPAGITVSRSGGLAIELSGSPEGLSECNITLHPAPNGCDNLALLWRAAAAAREQLLPAVCAPDPPEAHPKRLPARWGQLVRVPFGDLVRSVDRDGCLVYTAEVNGSSPWLAPSAGDIAGRAPSADDTLCQALNAYTCLTNLSAGSELCVVSLPDARVRAGLREMVCTEDRPCPLGHNLTVEPTEISDNDTVVSMLIDSNPSVLVGISFDANPVDTPEVHESAVGQLRVAAPIGRLLRQLPNALLSAEADFAGAVQISVRGASGTQLAAGPPLAVRFAQVNDAPRCKADCAKFELSCGLLGGERANLTERFWDVDDAELHYGANGTSHGVSVGGSTLLCSSVLALIAFYGIPLSGSAEVYARDAAGLQSPAVKVAVTYELSGTETLVVALITFVFSVYGCFLLLFQPGVFAWCRDCRRRAGGDRPPHGVLFCRVAPAAAAQLRAAQLAGLSVAAAGGCGLQWLRADPVALRPLTEGATDGAAAVIREGAVVVGLQPESAEDPGERQLCIAVGPRSLQLAGSAAPVPLSVLHEDSEAPLKLSLRLRHRGDSRAAIVWVAGATRVAALCRPGPDHAEYSGTARQVTEWAHMQRIAGPAGCRCELVWTLAEGNGGRDLIGGAIPVGMPGVATLCGADEAGCPHSPGAPAAGDAGAPAHPRGGGALAQPLLGPEQQQQQQQEGAHPLRRPPLLASVPSSSRGGVNWRQVMRELEQERLRAAEQSRLLEAERAAGLERIAAHERRLEAQRAQLAAERARFAERDARQTEAHRDMLRVAGSLADSLRETREEWHSRSRSVSPVPPHARGVNPRAVPQLAAPVRIRARPVSPTVLPSARVHIHTRAASPRAAPAHPIRREPPVLGPRLQLSE